MNNLNTQEKVYTYQLIKYNNDLPLVLSMQHKPREVFVQLTQAEAHDRNYAFALNREGKRYVKSS